MNYDVILKRTLDRITGVDKSEGSLIYDAVAPTCLELAQCYIYIEELEKRVFADTSYGEYLDRRTAERGIYRKQATKSIRKATFNVPVPLGSRWAKEELVYVVLECINLNHYKVECVQYGVIGNKYDGEMVNMDYIENINSAILGEVIQAGSDVESDESLRTRYFDSFEREAFGGNVKDYQEKVGSIHGVGQVKVYPAWSGAGTVKVKFINIEHNEPSGELVNMVQGLVDPTHNAGEGRGIAPIGHTVTVQGAEGVGVNVAFTLTFKGTDWNTIKDSVVQAIEAYFNDLRSKWSDGQIVVRISQLESRVLDVNGIVDIQNTTLNGSRANLNLSDEQIPSLSGVVNQ